MPKAKTLKEKPTSTKSPKKKFRLLTEEEMVFGFGPKPTDEQLEEFFSRPDGKGIPMNKAFSQIRANIKKRRES
jgi:hypothetical protein